MSRILVVDDDPDIRNLIGTFLKADGHTVEFAVNGIAGIGAALAAMPDLIVTRPEVAPLCQSTWRERLQ
ncbi:hypothetical protein D3C83_40070 [compost metagenome]